LKGGEEMSIKELLIKVLRLNQQAKAQLAEQERIIERLREARENYQKPYRILKRG